MRVMGSDSGVGDGSLMGVKIPEAGMGMKTTYGGTGLLRGGKRGLEQIGEGGRDSENGHSPSLGVARAVRVWK